MVTITTTSVAITEAHSHGHRSDSIRGTDYIATQIEGFRGQKFKI